MIIEILQITCFVLAVMVSDCQEQNSSNLAIGMKDGSVEKDVRTGKETTAGDKNNPTIIAYYFHRTMRCPGCLEIEANAQRVIENSFAAQITDEKLMWIPFNLDDPGGEEFEKQFDISTSTLVIAKMQDGEVTEFKKLEKVWQFVGDEQAFTEYVKGEVDGYLNDQ